MKFNENLKRICNDHGTSPTTILKELGVATSKLVLWNNGSLPKYEMMVRLADHLHCKVSDFFWDGEGEPSGQTSQPAKSELTPDEEDMLRIYRSLDRKGRHSLMAAIYTFSTEDEF